MKHYLWNFLAAIKNGSIAKKAVISFTYKKINEKISDLLWNEGFILGYHVDGTKIVVFLKYDSLGKPCINQMHAISKPGKRIYYSRKQLWKIHSVNSFVVISTNLGLKSLEECKRLKIGGEPLFLIN